MLAHDDYDNAAYAVSVAALMLSEIRAKNLVHCWQCSGIGHASNKCANDRLIKVDALTAIAFLQALPPRNALTGRGRGAGGAGRGHGRHLRVH